MGVCGLVFSIGQEWEVLKSNERSPVISCHPYCQVCRVHLTTSLVPQPNYLRISFEKNHGSELISIPSDSITKARASSSDGKGADGEMLLMVHRGRDRRGPSASYRCPIQVV